MPSKYLPYPPENPVVLREYDGLNWGERCAPLPKSISGKNGINNKARYRNRENKSQASVITDNHKAVKLVAGKAVIGQVISKSLNTSNLSLKVIPRDDN